jgi:hypothetical protein
MRLVGIEQMHHIPLSRKRKGIGAPGAAHIEDDRWWRWKEAGEQLSCP